MRVYTDWYVVFSFAILAFFIGYAGGTSYHATQESFVYNATVIDKIGAHGDSGIYLILTEDESFTIEDNIFKKKFDATDRYRNIEVGKQYNFKVTGIRNHFFSFYRNIIEFEELT